MPSIEYNAEASGKCWLLWKIDEAADHLDTLVPWDHEESTEINQISHPNKRLEWFAARAAIRELTKRAGITYQGIYKDPFGKPYLIENPAHISITHSFPYVGVVLDPRRAVGIDIEKPKEKLLKIAPRFLNDTEIKEAENLIEKLAIYWCAKESIYKMLGRNALIFKENIAIAPFQMKSKGTIYGTVIVKDSKKVYPIYYEKRGDFTLTLS